MTASHSARRAARLKSSHDRPVVSVAGNHVLVSEEGCLRADPLLPALALLKDFGVTPESVLAACGIPIDTLSGPETILDYAAACRFLQACSALTACEHFGLLVGMQGRPETLGIAGRLSLAAGDLGSALATLVRHLHLHDQGAVPHVTLERGVARLGYVISGFHPGGVAAAADTALAIGLATLRALLGEPWNPREVWLPRRSPVDPQPWHELVRAPVRFDAPFVAFLFDEVDLRRRIAGRRGHDGVAQPLPDLPLPVVVRRLAIALIVTGRCSVGEAADQLDMHPRTLNRQLMACGLTFRALADDARFDFARQLLIDTDMPIAQIAATLGYADTSTFTRRFGQRAGQPPAAWRAASIPHPSS